MSDLCTVADVLTELQIASPASPAVTARIAKLIATFSQAARTYTGNTFGTGDYIETFDGNCRSFYLLHRPVNSVAQVSDISQSPPVVQDSTTYGIDFTGGFVFPISQEIGFAFDLQESVVPFGDRLEVWGIGRQRWQVSYNAGIQAIPADVSGAVMRWVVGAISVTPGITSERIGDYSYTTNEMLSGMPGDVQVILNQYRGSKIRIA